MEDYERTNAREWDDPLRRPDFASTDSQSTAGGWSVVKGRTKKDKKENTSLRRNRQDGRNQISSHDGSLETTRENRKHIDISSAKTPSRTTSQRRKRSETPRKTPAIAVVGTPPANKLIPDLADSPAQDDSASAFDSSASEHKNRRHRLPPKLLQVDDNAAELAWRSHESPAAHLLIPVSLLSYGSHGKENVHENIARHHNTFIFCQDQGDNHHFNFGVWGDAESVRSAISTLNKWIRTSQDVTKSNRSFGRVNNLTSKDTQQRVIKQWEREMRKNRFRQNPPLDATFEVIGSVPWPVEQWRPEDTLGSSYEALDAIRMGYSCYITWQEEESAFMICGKRSKVEEAMQRVDGAISQIAARQISHQCLHLLYWPDTAFVPPHVSMTRYEHPLRLPGDLVTDRPGWVPRADGANLLAIAHGNPNRSAELELQEVILSTLPELLWYRGRVEFRIRLGTFLATRFKRPKSDGKYTLEEYNAMIRMPQFSGHVTPELGDRRAEACALTALRKSTSMLSPADSNCSSLANVEPEYAATFIFADPAGDIQLKMVWQHVTDASDHRRGSLEVSSRTWNRLERDYGALVEILDASLKDLHTSMAWNFGMSATQPISESRLSEAHQMFGQSVKIIPEIALTLTESNDQLFVAYRHPGPNMKLRQIQQTTVYRYTMLTSTKEVTDYALELARFQNFELPDPALTAPPTPSSSDSRSSRQLSQQRQRLQQVVQEPRWSLNVYRSGWDINFAENVDLKVGTMASWSPDGEAWFPEDLRTTHGVSHEESELEQHVVTDGQAMSNGTEQQTAAIPSDKAKVLKGFTQLLKMLDQVKDVVCEADLYDGFEHLELH